MDITALLIQLAAGAVGGNAGGAVAKNASLGTVGNTITGAVGGGLGGVLMNALAGGGLDSMIGQLAGGGVAGAVLTIIVGLIKNKMASKA